MPLAQTSADAGYSQVVSAALVTERSSGSWVGVLPLPWRTWTCTEDPLGFGGLTVAKSEPSTTCTVSPFPLTRSIVGSVNADATVAAASSLPGEKNTVVEFSGPVG